MWEHPDLHSPSAGQLGIQKAGKPRNLWEIQKRKKRTRGCEAGDLFCNPSIVSMVSMISMNGKGVTFKVNTSIIHGYVNIHCMKNTISANVGTSIVIHSSPSIDDRMPGRNMQELDLVCGRLLSLPVLPWITLMD